VAGNQELEILVVLVPYIAGSETDVPPVQWKSLNNILFTKTKSFKIGLIKEMLFLQNL